MVTASDVRFRIDALVTGRVNLHSSVDAMRREADYQHVLSCGWEAVPMLLDALKERPSTSVAIMALLVDITGENPVHDADAGNVSRVVGSWLTWARNRAIDSKR